MSPKHDLTDGAVRMIACPHCRQPVRWEPASRFRPFCSERCRLIDLGAWASERYAIPVSSSLDDEVSDEDGSDLRQTR